MATDQWPHGFSILEVDHQTLSTAIQAYIYMLRSIHRFVQLLCGVKTVMLVQPEGRRKSRVGVIGMAATGVGRGRGSEGGEGTKDGGYIQWN